MDIEIESITEQYMDFLHQQEKMNLESTGNWLYLLCQEGANSAKWSNILMSKDNVIISYDEAI